MSAAAQSQTGGDDAASTVGAPSIDAPAVASPPPSLESVVPAYQPTVARISEAQLLSARQEYERRATEGEEDFHVMVATRVPAQSWEGSSIDVRANGCRVDVVFSADMAFVDIELIDGIEGGPHAGAAACVVGQLFMYSQWQVDRELLPGVGKAPFTNENRAIVMKEPDAGLVTNQNRLPGPETPRLIVEVSVNHYTLSKAQRAYRDYFDGMPTVRTVLLLKFYGARVDGTAAAAAVLYRRDDQGAAFVCDSVSFGNTELEPIAEAALDKIDAMQGYRDLSGGLNGDFNAPAEIVIPATDLYNGTPLTDQNGALLHPRPDLVIDLRLVFLAYFDRI